MASAQVAPSILSADFGRLGDQVQEVVDAGARTIHVDVMDGHFVPPLSMGPQVVSALRERFGARIVLDCHLMVERPSARSRPSPARAPTTSRSTRRPRRTCTSRCRPSARRGCAPGSR
jgi:pentose-5-phosphate-3-epimerase